MTDIQKVTIALARPRGNFEGRVETGHYTVNDGTVTLVEPNGVPVDRFKLSRSSPSECRSCPSPFWVNYVTSE